MRRYLSTADAARVVHVTPATIRLMQRKKRLRVAARTEGGIHLFLRADVEALARRRAQKEAAHAR